MQFCDLENAEKNGIEAEIERLCDMQFIMPYHKKLIDPNAIHRFINSETYKEMKRSSHLRREVRFNTRLPAAMFTADRAKKTALKNDTILVQGVIDCYYVTDNGKTVLLDYKTDAFPEDMSERAVAATLRKRHSTQLYYYKIALERLLLRPVDRVEIFSFAIGKTISLRFKK